MASAASDDVDRESPSDPTEVGRVLDVDRESPSDPTGGGGVSCG